jgi:alkylation response protein AidB-like acyl-CoA dehydrogenase
MARAVLVADTTRAIVLPLEGGTGAVVQLDAAGARVRPRYTADLDRKVVDVEFDRVIPVMQASLADPDRAQSLAVSRALLAAEAVGAAERALEITIEHLRVRKQFGHPLAQFQALKHRCADDHVRLVTARSSTWYALRLADARQDATLAATIALHTARAAYRAIAESMVQLHGGVGYTWEHVAHRHLRRSLAICELLGGQGESEAEIAARGVVPAGAR